MKNLIDKAPEAIKRNFITRLYGSRSMAESYIAAIDYARVCHFDVPPYVPVYGPIAERIKATGDVYAFRTFVNAHAEELRAEQKCDDLWKKQREWTKGPSAEEVIAKNQAAASADRLEAEIQSKTTELLARRELAARTLAEADARAELTK